MAVAMHWKILSLRHLLVRSDCGFYSMTNRFDECDKCMNGDIAKMVKRTNIYIRVHIRKYINTNLICCLTKYTEMP